MIDRLTLRWTDQQKASAVKLLAFWLPFFVFAILVQIKAGAYVADLSINADESAHFTSSAMIHDYLATGRFESPMAFAKEYYSHFPRVAIGHWPPLFHVLQAIAFVVGGVRVSVAMVFQAVIAALAGATIAVIVGRQTSWVFGGFSAAALLAAPDFMFSLNTIMLDNFVGLLIMLAALAWANYARTLSRGWAATFGFVAAAAILTKGNAYGLALLPLLHAGLSRRWTLLLLPRTYIAAAIVLIATVPWYIFTYRLAANGFVYHWGLDYTGIALKAFLPGLAQLLGIMGLGILIFGGGSAIVDAWGGQRDETVLSCLAAAGGIFIFICVVPADVSPRYLLDLLPSAILAAALGLSQLLRQSSPSVGTIGQHALLCVIIVLNIVLTMRFPHLDTMAMDKVAGTILATPDDSPLVLISGTGRVEGAFVAAFAEKDRDRSHFVVRGSKALASSDFMGKDYQPLFKDEADLERWIEDSRIGWVVIVDTPLLPNMAHMQQMAALAATHPARWHLVGEQITRFSHTSLFRIDTDTPNSADLARVLKQLVPAQSVGSE
jgi:hypothetical protein